ncbi:MAG: class A beta-lactamase-related serine hydrolase [Anaerolineae bacterium]|nr:class A beta-lactamase-related serine hydrolase [Anaerolineae bacterium]MDW8173317.1 serine hydrolase [Anaerolineae bacterium]
MSHLNRSRRCGVSLLQPLSLLMILAGVGLLVFYLLNFAQSEDRLANGITIAGVPVSGLRQNEAIAAIEQAYAQPVTLIYPGNPPFQIIPATLGFRLNTPSMLAEAVASSERGGGFWERFANYMLGITDTSTRSIPLVADYQRSVLEAELRRIAQTYDRAGGQAAYDVATLTVASGNTGVQLNIEGALALIDDALRRPNNRLVELPVSGGLAAQANIKTLESLIIAYLDSRGFVYDGQTSVASIYIQDLRTGQEVNILGDVAFTAASTIKFPILIDYFRVLDGEPSQDDASLMANSLLCSNNSSSNRIMEVIIGRGDLFRGIASVTSTAQYLGAKNTFLTAPFITGEANQRLGSIAAPRTSPNPNYNTQPDPFNQTTAEDLGSLFGLVYDCAKYNGGLMAAYPNGEFNQTECRRMLELMSGLKLQRLLEGGVPAGTRISYKNGWVGEVTGVAGVVFPPNGRDYVISVFIWEDTGARGFQDYVRLWPIIEDISRAAWNYFSPESALLDARRDLPPSAQECFRRDASGNIIYEYLPPYGQINLDDIDGWRSGS